MNDDLNNVEIYRKFDFEWMEDRLCVAVNDSDGNEMACLTLEKLKDLVARGILKLNHSIDVFFVKDREPTPEGEAIHYSPSVIGDLEEVMQELELRQIQGEISRLEEKILNLPRISGQEERSLRKSKLTCLKSVPTSMPSSGVTQ